MSKGINKAIVLGYMGSDPTVRYTTSGKAVATVSIATSETWTDKATGEKKEKTDWHKVIFYGKHAEIIGEYGKKGVRLYVCGKMSYGKYVDKSQIERTTFEIIASEFQILEYKNSDEQEPKKQELSDNSFYSQNNMQDDDIPF
jgi:single-strand DNA-binding protein